MTHTMWTQSWLTSRKRRTRWLVIRLKSGHVNPRATGQIRMERHVTAPRVLMSLELSAEIAEPSMSRKGAMRSEREHRSNALPQCPVGPGGQAPARSLLRWSWYVRSTSLGRAAATHRAQATASNPSQSATPIVINKVTTSSVLPSRDIHLSSVSRSCLHAIRRGYASRWVVAVGAKTVTGPCSGKTRPRGSR